MFITDNAFKSPLSGFISDQSESYWTTVELALHDSWFIVTFRQDWSPDSDGSINIGRTLMLSDLSRIEPLIELRDGGHLELESVQMVSPAHVNGTQDWNMERLSSVWLAEEPSSPGQLAEIYETTAGTTYVSSVQSTPLEAFATKELRYCFPRD